VIDKLRMNRRYFLKGVGVAMALPMLDIMAEPKSSQKQSPKRLACFYVPDGVALPPKEDPAHKDWNWFPLGDKNNYKFTKSLQSMQGLREETTIISGLSHPPTRNKHGHACAGAFLTGTFVGPKGKYNTISIDQLYANLVGKHTRISSLVMSTDGGVGTPTSSQTMSFNSGGRPISAESSPKRLFNRMFVTPGAEELSDLATKKSVLDSVLENSKVLQKKLGKVDKERFDHYLEAVREVEKRLKKSEEWVNVPKPKIDAEINSDVLPGEARAYVRTMYDLIWLAFQTDSTRVATYQIAQEGAYGVSDNLATAVGFRKGHSLTHATKDKDGWKNLGIYDQFLADEFAHFINRLKSTKDSIDPLLDNTLCLYGSASSKYHTSRNYPLILAGAKNLKLKHGQFLKFDEEKTQLSNLHLTMLQQLGVEVEKFSDSTGTFSEVLL